MHGTRHDRLQALVKAWREAGSPTENDQAALAFEVRLYAGEQRILHEPQPWIGDIGPEVDYNRLEECDRLVMDAIRESGRLPRLEGGFDVATPSYLTAVFPGDKAILTAREAIELGAAFPYARGRRQLPLGERIIVNYLYGTPLYQPAEQHLDSERSARVHAAAAIIKVNPKFIPDWAVRSPSGPRSLSSSTWDVGRRLRLTPAPWTSSLITPRRDGRKRPRPACYLTDDTRYCHLWSCGPTPSLGHPTGMTTSHSS